MIKSALTINGIHLRGYQVISHLGTGVTLNLTNYANAMIFAHLSTSATWTNRKSISPIASTDSCGATFKPEKSIQKSGCVSPGLNNPERFKNANGIFNCVVPPSLVANEGLSGSLSLNI